MKFGGLVTTWTYTPNASSPLAVRTGDSEDRMFVSCKIWLHLQSPLRPSVEGAGRERPAEFSFHAFGKPVGDAGCGGIIQTMGIAGLWITKEVF